MTAPVRIGVVGSGFGARVVAPVFAATDGCAVIDVVSARDADEVARLCARRDLDLVSVHVPPFLHAEVVVRALDAGHAVLCDKPFGANTGDAQRMVDAAATASQPALVNFEFRADPARRQVADLLDAGTLGTIERVSWTHWSAGSRRPLRPHGWLFERAAGGGWLGAWGSHALDTLRWWLGDLTVVSAHLTTGITERPDREGVLRACDAEDGMTASLRTDAGVIVTVDSTFAASVTIAPRVVIAGSEGVAEVVADRRVTVRRADPDREEWTAPTTDGDPHLVPMRAWAGVVRAVVCGERSLAGVPTFADGLVVRTLLDRMVAVAAERGDGR